MTNELTQEEIDKMKNHPTGFKPSYFTDLCDMALAYLDLKADAVKSVVLPEGWIAVRKDVRNADIEFAVLGGYRGDKFADVVSNIELYIAAQPPCPILTEAQVADKALEQAAKACEQVFSDPAWNAQARNASLGCADAIRALQGRKTDGVG